MVITLKKIEVSCLHVNETNEERNWTCIGKFPKKKRFLLSLCHVISNLHCDARRRDIYIFYYEKKKNFFTLEKRNSFEKLSNLKFNF